MRKIIFACLTALFLLVSAACAPPRPNVYDYYSGGPYETTLTEDNAYTVLSAEELYAKLDCGDPVLILVGAAWCPYCANDIGIIDRLFRQSETFELFGTIYYTEAEDSQISAQTIMEINERLGTLIRPTIPCLLAVENGKLIADRNAPEFKEESDREKQIALFFGSLSSHGSEAEPAPAAIRY